MRLALLVALLASACSSPSQPRPAEPGPPAPASVADAASAPGADAPAAVDAAGSAPLGDAGAVAVPPADASTPLADGAACQRGDQCASGLCEGQGCGLETPGRCAPAKRGCTRDLRSYCGCDGQTFKASGSCPGRRYESKGTCTTNRPEGASCLKATDCASKICEGAGCSDAQPGRCAPTGARDCTADAQLFCGCDGAPHNGSGTCPGVRYAHRGMCEGP